MVDPVLLFSHAIAVLLGLGLPLTYSSGQAECPACIVTCGSISCPPVHCSTGHIELGTASIFALGCLIGLALLSSWCFHRSEAKVTGPGKEPIGQRPALVDGRRPLGRAVGWQPEAR